IGYLSPHKLQVEQENCATGPPPEIPMEETVEAELRWKDITQLLQDKLSSQAFDTILRKDGMRQAGSKEDLNLADRIFNEFKKQNMDPWTDIHYVQLQSPDSKRPNRVIFGSNDFHPQGYLAYSAPGRVEGKLVYGNYGCQEDLDVLQKNHIELNGCVMLLRAGKISFAEQVDNAATKGASAVLIYPDSKDYSYNADTALYGHVHLGSGDPYTPGFPSFNHTQFPPTRSSGLPKIPAQTITASIAKTLLQEIGGLDANDNFTGGFPSLTYRLGGKENITVEVNNVLVNTEIHNVFGVIKGLADPDRYVVLGAQRDTWDNGYAKSTVGTSVLVELAKAIQEMVDKDGFRPRRSLVFASWTAGEYGTVGATEWLEAYMTSVDKNVLSYINLDGVSLNVSDCQWTEFLQTTDIWNNNDDDDNFMRRMRPMSIDDPAYPFLASFGIPSISFHFISPNVSIDAYPYYGTSLDNMDHLNYKTDQKTSKIAVSAAQLAGQMALRLVHDHIIRLDVSHYTSILNKAIGRIYTRVNQLTQVLKGVDPSWLTKARGNFWRAADDLKIAIQNSDLSDKEACRILNGRVMRIERNLLSPYVSPIDTPFRHFLLGRGPHTLTSIAESTDMKQLHTYLALASWGVQGCASAMEGNVWDINNVI
uniref:Uncharacterized protein n=1 Tax=Mola mola TaxID=94237 RepID=A0A3Q4AKS5_MOLML